jgi:tRNA nucleotidyltransferase/poly(A) polymerase
MFRVGGCVRDELLGLDSKDIDFAVEAPSFETMLEAVEARCSKVFLVTPEFLTIRGLDPELGAVDFVLCRKDGPSTDGRRPDFVEAGTILDDLARRDFTVNAMARDEEGVLLDPHGGREDLEAGLLRFVGSAEDRLAEDALRAFRALRFSVTKRFTITDETAEALRAMHAEAFDAVSTDRMRDELHKMFSTDTAAALVVLAQFPLLLEVALSRGLWLKPTTEAAK